MLHTSPSFGRSSSAYSMGFPNMSQIMNTSNLLSPTSTSGFQFNSPFRSYLKTNEIKQRKVLHKTVVMKLTNIISSQNSQKIQRKSLQLNRRGSGQQLGDQNQEQWESLKIRFELEQYDKDVIYELFQEMLKQSSLIQIDKYQLPITTKQEFSKFKHSFILVFLFDQQLMKIIMKLEQLRYPLLKTPTLYQEMKGYSTISQIINQLYQNIIKDITLLPLVVNIGEKEFIAYGVQLMSNLLQSNQGELWKQLYDYSEKYQLNHVHYTHFKLMFYKVLLQFNINERGIRKSLKIIDTYKSAILRAKPMKEYVNDQSNSIDYYTKNQEVAKKHLQLLFEYITNNNDRCIKKDDIIMLNLNPKIGETIVQTFKQHKPNHLLFQDFIQDVKSCLSQNYKIPERLITKFGKRMNYIPFFATIYKENQIDYKKLVETEMDFITQNRTHFRKKEIQLIHKRFKITNELFDSYIQTLSEVMGVYGPHLVNRLNHYRQWIIIND